MSEYNTEQKKMLTAFLQRNCDRAYTIEELIAELNSLHGSTAPGKSTVYRLMARLVDEGHVKRLVKGHGRNFVYQGVRGDSCRCHLHMKCVGCGKLFHIDEKLSDELLTKVKELYGFSVSEEETVLLGRCGACH